MATSWTLVVAAPLARVAASVEPLAAKPALSALGAAATVARFESDAASPGALAFELRGLLGTVVDEVGPEGLRALQSLDGVADLDAARAAPGSWIVPPAIASFAAAAALLGGGPRPDAAPVKDADELAAKVHAALDARDDATARENKLRASRGMAEWDAVFGVKPTPDAAGAVDLGPRVGSGASTKERDAMRDALRAEQPAKPEEPAPLEKSAKRKELEDLLRRGGSDPDGGGSAPPEGGVGKP